MKKGMLWIMITICTFASVCLSACASKKEQIQSSKKPVLVTFWHSYNNFAKSVLDEMILEFNDTVGAEKGIMIDSYGYGEQKKMEDALYDSANKVIGAEKMPDMFVSYADNARRINEYAPLVDLNQYFSEDELGEYRQEFLEEGIWEDGAPLRMLPVAKSTELVYVNATDWKKFAFDIGRSDSEAELEAVFSSWDRIVEMAQLYFQWSGGKPMLGINLNNDIMYVTALQLGETPYDIIDGKAKFKYSRETAKKIWDICYVPHIEGWFESAFYNQDATKEARIIAYIGSSAGSGFFPLEVTLDASNSYAIKSSVVSYPSFDENSRYMTQRGANISMVKTDEAHEYAGAEFLKWFTAEDQSIKFAASTGYIPVKNKALENKDKIQASVSSGENREAVKKSVLTTLKAVDTRKFIAKRPFDNSYKVNSIFSNSIFEKIDMDLIEKNQRIASGESEQEVIARLCGEDNFNVWYNEMLNDIEACIE